VDQIRGLGWKGVMGNTDQMLALADTFESFASQSPKLASLWDILREMAAFTRELLGEGRLAWLRNLQLTQVHDPIAIVHAIPGNPWYAPSLQASDEELVSRYSSLTQPIAIYGHIHLPFVRTVGSLTVANSGSVGLPYDGDRRASYLLIDGFQVQIRRVEYDLAKELQSIRNSGIPHADWIARTLQSGSPQMP
jgi:diadenosine tetraphosphatase ApaH/serine/threonine PP2A family protein phosphatase